MPERRRTALLGVLVAALPALALVARLPAHPQILAVLNNAAHAPVFGALAIVWFFLLDRSHPSSPWRRYVVAFALTIAIGGLVEVIQPRFGRGAELLDLLNDTLGAAVALALVAYVRSRRILYLLIAIALLVPVVQPVAQAAIAYASRADSFPVLFGESARADRYFIRTSGVEAVHSALPLAFSRPGDPQSLKIRIQGERWPGVTHSEPFPDWQHHSRLMVDLTNPDSLPLTLTLRIHDLAHNNCVRDRFNRTFTLAAEQRSVLAIPLSDIASAPEGRALDLSQVAGIILFGEGSPQQVGHEFYITRIWLE
jgi:VanZ family protein